MKFSILFLLILYSCSSPSLNDHELQREKDSIDYQQQKDDWQRDSTQLSFEREVFTQLFRLGVPVDSIKPRIIRDEDSIYLSPDEPENTKRWYREFKKNYHTAP